jgi:phenylalanyl-tRNA synthetase alpha chain
MNDSVKHDEQGLVDEARSLVSAAADGAALANAKARFLGKDGLLTARMKALGTLTPAERGPVGKRLNEVKQAIEALVGARQQALDQAA